MSRARLEEEHLGEDDLVVELLELFQQVLSHGEGDSVVAGVYLSDHVRQHGDNTPQGGSGATRPEMKERASRVSNGSWE